MKYPSHNVFLSNKHCANLNNIYALKLQVFLCLWLFKGGEGETTVFDSACDDM